jgi:hypothetical protein
LVIGHPVDSTKDPVETDRGFYGASIDLGTFVDTWDFSFYFNQQDVDGITDRRAVGTETRYFKNKHSVFSLLDYDIFYDELNLFLLLGNWTVSDTTSLYYSYDKRKNPLLSSFNAIQGQQVDSIEDLLGTFSEEEIFQLAQDRTADAETINLGLTNQLSENWQMASDFTVSEFSETNTSGGVEGIPGTGSEYFYNFQLNRNNLFMDNDLNSLNLRYQDTSSSEKWTARLTGRYPINAKLRLRPKLQFSRRTRINNKGTTNTAELSSRIYYRLSKKFSLELELGYEKRKEITSSALFNEDNYFIYLGYNYDFQNY